LYTIKPAAVNKEDASDKPVIGEKALVEVKATRGGKKPFVSENTSNLADAFGVVVPIPVWAKEPIEINKKKSIFFIFI
jgi:hypothetical protein